MLLPVVNRTWIAWLWWLSAWPLVLFIASWWQLRTPITIRWWHSEDRRVDVEFAGVIASGPDRRHVTGDQAFISNSYSSHLWSCEARPVVTRTAAAVDSLIQVTDPSHWSRTTIPGRGSESRIRVIIGGQSWVEPRKRSEEKGGRRRGGGGADGRRSVILSILLLILIFFF